MTETYFFICQLQQICHYEIGNSSQNIALYTTGNVPRPTKDNWFNLILFSKLSGFSFLLLDSGMNIVFESISHIYAA